jgi:hypothetical protein
MTFFNVHWYMIVCRLEFFFQDNGVAGFDFLKAIWSEVTVDGTV